MWMSFFFFFAGTIWMLFGYVNVNIVVSRMHSCLRSVYVSVVLYTMLKKMQAGAGMSFV